MVYDTYISDAKKLLDSTSEAGKALEKYYADAKAGISSDYKESLNILSSQYYDDKNAAGSKSLLDTKNMDQFLAARGLSKSGESIQSRINSNLSLNTSLTELAKENYKSLTELNKNKNDAMAELDLAQGQYQYDREKWINQLAFDIASAEVSADQRAEDIQREEKQLEEQRLYNESVRLDEQERADRLLYEQQYREDLLKQDERSYQEKLMEDERLYKERLLEDERAYSEKITAEERVYKEAREQAQREYEQLLRQAEVELEAAIKAEERAYQEGKTADQRTYQEKLLAEERAYKEAQDAAKREYEQLLRKAEIELEAAIKAEERAYSEKLLAQEREYQKSISSSGSSGTSSGTNGSSGSSGGDSAYTPSSSAKDLAKSLVASTTGGSAVSGTADKVKVYNYIQELASQGVSSTYLKELELNLKAMGYTAPSAEQVKGYGLAEKSRPTYSNSLQEYQKVYKLLSYSQYEAEALAQEDALNQQLDYIYKRCESESVFNTACEALGVSAARRTGYYQRLKKINSGTGSKITLGMLL